MRPWLVNIVIVLASFSLATSALAQEDDTPEMRKRVVVDKENGVTVTRPEGWVSGKKKSGGTLAVFRPAGDSEAQIDILVSPLDESSASAFFTSFHAHLHEKGFAKLNVRKDATYNGKVGIETEYNAASKARLIVWQFHRGKVAVVVTGFFPTDQRDRHYKGFKEVLEKVELK